MAGLSPTDSGGVNDRSRDGQGRGRGRGRDQSDQSGRRAWRPTFGRTHGERAQLILIAGFVIAVSLVGLALIVNTAIFTENLATRSETSGAVDALAYRSATEQGLNAMLEFENDQHPDDPATAESDMQTAIAEYSELSTRQQAPEGRVVDLDHSENIRGHRLFQNESSRNFSSTDSNLHRNWELVGDTSNVRQFRIGVSDQGTLATFGPAGGDAFRVLVNKSGWTGTQGWWFNVTKKSGGRATIAISDASNDVSTCTETVGTNDDFWINVTAGTLDGAECEPLQFAEDVSGPYQVYYLNGSKIVGNYSLVVDDDNPTVGNYGPSTEGPVQQDTVYAVEADLVYRTAKLNYTTVVRIAPGEPHG